MAMTRGTERSRKRICIYGMGDYGLEIYFKLKKSGVKIDFFADRNFEKRGYALEGVYCRSYEELLCENLKKCLLIVAVKNPDRLIIEFKRQGFDEVYDKETAVKILGNRMIEGETEPLREIEKIEQMKEAIRALVYSHKEICCQQIENIIVDYTLRHSIKM